MSRIGRLVGLLAFPSFLWAANAEAQIRPPDPAPEALTNEAAPRTPAEVRLARYFRASPDGIPLTGTIPVASNMQFAVGRLSVPSFRAPRMEADEIRRGYRNIAAIGFSLRF
ncbi:MAG TPA: hypothetical protein VIT38_03830 [Allosphingosinicella sp.]|jgi:hypothetical protein